MTAKENPAIADWLESCNRAAQLIHATDDKVVAELEKRFGLSQTDAVTHLVEQTEWGLETFPQYQEGQGAFADRLAAVRENWASWEELDTPGLSNI